MPNGAMQPILILGTGRCGSTVFYRMLAHHPDLAFLSNINVQFPGRPNLWHLNTAFNKWALRRGWVRPAEAYPVFDKVFPGYRHPMRTLTANDVSVRIHEGIRHLFWENMQYQGKSRFVYKYTGWSRIGFFNEIFPDALFIHVVRDDRAVAHSLMNVPWWRGWQGPQNWRWGELPDSYEAEWRASGQSFALLAGIEWKMILDEIESSRTPLPPERFLTVKYEDLVDNPSETFRTVTEFSGLSCPSQFRQDLERFVLKDQNPKYREELPDAEVAHLDKSLEHHLRYYGYNVSE